MKTRVIIIAAALICLGQVICQAKRERFEDRTVVYKGEHIVGLGINYLNVDAKNWGIFQVITGVDAKGSILKIAPQYSYAFAKNQTAGVRFKYVDIQGGANNIDIDLLGALDDPIKIEDININSRNIGVTAFYRKYFGLDRKGNVGFYLEAALGYTNTHSVMGTGEPDGYTNGHKIHMNLSPGFIVYIVPMASLHCQFGIADVSWNQSTVYQDGVKSGNLSRWNGGVGFRLMDILFGVTYHF